jgi:hypothetical protein
VSAARSRLVSPTSDRLRAALFCLALARLIKKVSVETGPGIQNSDVAPTIARLLGLPPPGVDGKPLAAALAE